MDEMPRFKVFDNGMTGWKHKGKIYLSGYSWRALAVKNLIKKGKL